MTDQEELGQALVDVRKAYRLLYFFQRRMLDLLEELSGKLGQEFYYWLPAGDQGSIRAADNPMRTSPWKLLPMYNASFLFLPHGFEPDAPRKGQWLLELLFYDDGEPDGGGEEPNPAEFDDPAESHSKIYLCAFISQENLQKNWYSGIYVASEWPELDEVPEAKLDGVRVIGLSVDIASLPDSSAVDALADRFRALVKRQGGNITEVGFK